MLFTQLLHLLVLVLKTVSIKIIEYETFLNNKNGGMRKSQYCDCIVDNDNDLFFNDQEGFAKHCLAMGLKQWTAAGCQEEIFIS